MFFKALPDMELIRYCTEGNDRAFNELFRRYFNKLYQFSLQYVKDETIAESLVLDLLLQVWQKSGNIKQDGEIAPYLFKAMKNTVLNHVRKRHRQVLTLDEIPEKMSSNTLADENLEAKELETAYREMLEQLSPQRKKVFQMSRDQQMSHQEIASILQLSVNTVNNHINASTSFLRNKLKGFTDIAIAIVLYFFSGM
ncbi:MULTISPECIES: RNA polymerase sigma factor [Sphingobacterium]|uniref:RNA polymerase sigma factor n=1 Tax=Sphingobacterium TaxID=28453 RepID=UPI0021A45F61|nr:MULTISPECIES: RNA polymerase sigma-70 factor [Sphingobacterium]MCT1524877.1 RNA polymerase sigma-70 factor [Sphingobacterium hotanense]